MNQVYVMSQETFFCGLRSWHNCIIDLHKTYESAEIEVTDYIFKDYVLSEKFKKKSEIFYHSISDNSPEGYTAEYYKWFGLRTCVIKIHKQTVNDRHKEI